ncbi:MULTISPECIES: thioredoxin family protein [Emticicia]|uniref:thioredoxin family protein n=1 Tax=Emticicia TaxID=312278 RepID=UPI0007D8991D|nr:MULTISPECIES: thioredoxin family protein [Emticicia]
MILRSFFVFLLLITQLGFSQVKFESFDDLQTLLTAAQTRNKLIFVQTKSDNCNQCNDVARMGLSSTKLREKYAQNFISIEVDMESKIYKQLIKKTTFRVLPSSIFLDTNADLIGLDWESHFDENKYLELADNAITNAKDPVRRDLEAKYKSGNRDKDFLKKYIEYKISVEHEVESITEEYINLHTIGELSTIENVKLLINTASPIDSKIRKVLYAVLPEKMTDSLFRILPFNQRVIINSKISGATFRKAATEKNSTLAGRLATFVSNGHGKDWEKGSFFYQTTILRFYKEVKDTLKFLSTAETFANYTLMTSSLDTLLKRDSIARSKYLASTKKDTLISESYNSFYQKYADELNDIAYRYFEYSNDLNKLNKALKWAKRALEINEVLSMDASRKKNPYMMDTYAQLLFKLGQKEDAIKWQTDVIETAKLWKADTTKFEETLEKMKQ